MNEFVKCCPECNMSFGMQSALSKADSEFRCTANPAHKFKLGNDGFLQSI